MSEEFPDITSFNISQQFRLEILGMEYVVMLNSCPKGGSYSPDRAIVKGPYWEWVARIVCYFTHYPMSWAVPESMKGVFHVNVSPVTLTHPWYEVLIACFSFVFFVTGALQLDWGSILHLLNLLLILFITPRLRAHSKKR